MAKFGDIEFERRVFPRFVMHLPFSYQLVDPHPITGKPESISISNEQSNNQAELEIDEMNQMGLTENASQGGLMIYLPEEVAIGQQIKIIIAVARRKSVKNIATVVKVQWISKTTLAAPRLFKAGVAFDNISDEALTFIKWFEQLWLAQIK